MQESSAIIHVETKPRQLAVTRFVFIGTTLHIIDKYITIVLRGS